LRLVRAFFLFLRRTSVVRTESGAIVRFRVEQMAKIVAIGGGDVARHETLPIDREIVRLTGKARPRALFIPTASGDAPELCRLFRDLYGERLDCATETLLLLREEPTEQEIADRLLNADIIYVGGGNTLAMLELWRRRGVDRLLHRAALAGKVLAGMSAGANCWFRHGLSDSQKFTQPSNWKLMRVRGLGLIDLVGCPHYHSGRREEALKNLIGQYGGMALALDDNAALMVVDDRYRIIKSRPRAMAYRVFKDRLDVVVEAIEPQAELLPLAELLARAPSAVFKRMPRTAPRPTLNADS
jgi:dipeptidase E